MKYLMEIVSVRFVFTPIIIFLMCSFYAPTTTAKEACKKYLNTLHNIQQQQRQGNSIKQAERLSQREKKARNKWWQCENSSKVSKIAKHSAKNTAKRSGKKPAKKADKTKKKIITVPTPFKNASSYFVKQRFTGVKQKAWWQYYQQPDECRKPKSLPVFASCSENKLAQQDVFEKEYLPK